MFNAVSCIHTNHYFKRYFSVIGWCRAEWEVLETVIGQVDEPFQVTLLYTTCLGEDGSTVALDSLEFIDCEAGEFIMFQRAVLHSHFCKTRTNFMRVENCIGLN